ncbi:unnamed protein product [Adineta steineri]|uniref:Uncharacterized protein n=1 Tax=Adineta steineri TaxID=433720 RepID=A0A818VBW9_9BILA|nr:unnamed protein product [Adineta steineri]CAF3710345.1 unnamed protein product [Adineta steineri]
MARITEEDDQDISDNYYRNLRNILKAHYHDLLINRARGHPLATDDDDEDNVADHDLRYPYSNSSLFPGHGILAVDGRRRRRRHSA